MHLHAAETRHGERTEGRIKEGVPWKRERTDVFVRRFDVLRWQLYEGGDDRATATGGDRRTTGRHEEEEKETA